uniref:Methyltransferase HEMK2 n=1 Tax=Phallusia mammillata TaxID=59560 RepID=A0A6F9DLV4_9ASCI|nr:hemK methyltransferase family member 2-like [Phallusia mammillata]
MSIATPDYRHLKDFPDVYEPAEDTFLLLDALEKEQNALNKLRPTLTLEVGSGSGIVTTFLAKILQSKALHLVTDRNSQATLCTQQTANYNETRVDAINTDLVHGLLPRLQNCVDILILNPPYVVTPSHELLETGIAWTWAGGICGREVMDRLFPDVPKLLSKRGIFYLVVVQENKPKEIMKMFENMEFASTVVLNRRAGPENLSVIKFWKKGTEDGS